MKKYLILFTALIISINTYSQEKSLLFESSELVWCGLDFSMAKCIGSIGFTNPKAIKEEYFSKWNDLMLAEPSKFNFKKAYQKTTQITDLSVVNRRNELPDHNTLVINEPYKFEDGTIEKIISDYDLNEVSEGLGLVYIYEALDKTNVKAVINVVFFDIATKKIIQATKYTSPPAGFGIRNYWAKPIYASINASAKSYNSDFKAYKKALKKK